LAPAGTETKAVSVRILTGDCRKLLKSLPDNSVHCAVTSPPYFGLRDYGCDGQIGLEATPEDYVAALVSIFGEVRRVLRDDGTLWLNLGDSYANDPGNGRGSRPERETLGNGGGSPHRSGTNRASIRGLKRKDLIGVPWMTAFALRADGWYFRQAMPWIKRNPMPESVRDRPCSACEYVFMFAKSAKYYYDYEAVQRRMVRANTAKSVHSRKAQNSNAHAHDGRNYPFSAVKDKQRGHSRRHAGFNARWDAMERSEQRRQRAYRNNDLFLASLDPPHGAIGDDDGFVALDVATKPFRGAHFATFPPDLITPLILAGCPIDGTVLDPFSGAGTVGVAAERLQRHSILIELNPHYSKMAERRIVENAPLLTEIAKQPTL
jgi:DNA modification methylase